MLPMAQHLMTAWSVRRPRLESRPVGTHPTMLTLLLIILIVLLLTGSGYGYSRWRR
jgi:hypothetical protein